MILPPIFLFILISVALAGEPRADTPGILADIEASITNCQPLDPSDIINAEIDGETLTISVSSTAINSQESFVIPLNEIRNIRAGPTVGIQFNCKQPGCISQTRIINNQSLMPSPRASRFNFMKCGDLHEMGELYGLLQTYLKGR